MPQKSPTLTPSLESLSYILRHREFWPVGFQWSFLRYSQCAGGLAERLWDKTPKELGMGWLERCKTIWGFGYRGTPIRFVTPEQVADRIDRYLARRVDPEELIYHG